MLTKFILYCQSLSESHIPDSLLKRLVTSTREFPPVCAILGGILGQVPVCSFSLSFFFLFVFLSHTQIYSNLIAYNVFAIVRNLCEQLVFWETSVFRSFSKTKKESTLVMIEMDNMPIIWERCNTRWIIPEEKHVSYGEM